MLVFTKMPSSNVICRQSLLISFLSDPPNVTTLEPLELIVNHTQSATFVCEAYGIPIPAITWVKVVNETVVIEASGVIDITEEIVRVNTRESVLTFLDTVKTDESIYRCEGENGITNVIGSPENDTVSLLVQGEPCVLVYVCVCLRALW